MTSAYSFSTVLAVIVLLSCKSKPVAEYQDGKQLLFKSVADNQIRLGKKGLDSIKAGDELVVRIFSSEKSSRIVDAFLNCEWEQRPMVDTATYSVTGCSTALLVKADTLRIGFRPTEVGTQFFPEINVLTKDADGIFSMISYSFTYTVF